MIDFNISEILKVWSPEEIINHWNCRPAKINNYVVKPTYVTKGRATGWELGLIVRELANSKDGTKKVANVYRINLNNTTGVRL